ncbi:MAG: CpaD family pilus assembly protein [Alphaproteobacteria bacterium]|nr:CpaD family pilus assembly protein [Alphaproteobacteria bacterium]
MNAVRLTPQYSHRHLKISLLSMVCGLTLSACAQIDMPSHVSQQRPQLVTENYSSNYVVADLGPAQFDEMAARFGRHGSGTLEVIVGYDPHSKKNTAMKATDQLHRVLGELSQRGVRNVKGSILALDNSGDQSEMMIGYKSVNAEGPADCEMMPGYDNSQAQTDYDYKLGCTVNTLIARQVAHPEDLGGRAVPVEADGRRTGAMVEPYRSGQPNSALSGAYSASD